MKLYVDTASLSEIEEWDAHPWVSGFTTNPTLMTTGYDPPIGGLEAWDWAREVVRLTDKPISIDGPPEVWELGPNVYRKVAQPIQNWRSNYTAVCTVAQVEQMLEIPDIYRQGAIISVFAGRIMDTGRNPRAIIEAAKKTGAQVLWASVREPYNIVNAEMTGCDIVTVPPAILRKWLDWNGKPLEVVAAETIAQFEKDSEGLWT
jgi:transaldolase